jgi:hypothetical protein
MSHSTASPLHVQTRAHVRYVFSVKATKTLDDAFLCSTRQWRRLSRTLSCTCSARLGICSISSINDRHCRQISCTFVIDREREREREREGGEVKRGGLSCNRLTDIEKRRVLSNSRVDLCVAGKICLKGTKEVDSKSRQCALSKEMERFRDRKRSLECFVG